MNDQEEDICLLEFVEFTKNANFKVGGLPPGKGEQQLEMELQQRVRGNVLQQHFKDDEKKGTGKVAESFGTDWHLTGTKRSDASFS